jgi:hypothetical protein
MKTLADMTKEWKLSIVPILEELQGHCMIRRWNRPGSYILSGGADFCWVELPSEARPIQARVLEEYRRLHDVLQALLCGQPDDTLRELKQANEVVLGVIKQEGWLHHATADEAFLEATEALETAVGLISRLYSAEEDTIILVPDTNTLLYNPDLDSWDLYEGRQYRLVLLPTVLAELDKHKINHRNESVRKCSERLIRQIKEYRRRGSLIDGVTLRTGKSVIQTVAIEPDLSKSLPWLDASNEDDRLLAAMIEVIRRNPRAYCVLVHGISTFRTKLSSPESLMRNLLNLKRLSKVKLADVLRNN